MALKSAIFELLKSFRHKFLSTINFLKNDTVKNVFRPLKRGGRTPPPPSCGPYGDLKNALYRKMLRGVRGSWIMEKNFSVIKISKNNFIKVGWFFLTCNLIFIKKFWQLWSRLYFHKKIEIFFKIYVGLWINSIFFVCF